MSQTNVEGEVDKPIRDLTVEEVAALVTKVTKTSKYEAAVRANGLDGEALSLTQSWEDIRDHCGVTFSAHAMKIFNYAQEEKTKLKGVGL